MSEDAEFAKINADLIRHLKHPRPAVLKHFKEANKGKEAKVKAIESSEPASHKAAASVWAKDHRSYEGNYADE